MAVISAQRQRWRRAPVALLSAGTATALALLLGHVSTFLQLRKPASSSHGSFLGSAAPSWRRAGATLAATSERVQRWAADPEAATEKWRVGPADVYSGQAQKALYLLKENPELFEDSVEEELEKLNNEKDAARAQEAAANKDVKDQDALALRSRVKEVREQERLRIAYELIYLKTCNYFIKMEVPLIPTLKGGGDIKFGQRSVNLKGLTDIYSVDALALVRDHLFGILGMQGNPFGTTAVVQIALFQAGQVYAMSALFGYYVRRVDARFQLEKLAGSFGSFGDEASDDKGTAAFAEDKEAAESLKDYVTNFGPEELQQMTAIASVEAQMAMESQVTALFGDLRVLKETLLEAVGMVISNEEATEKLQKAIEEQKVESIRITTDDLRRLVLEAVAFGALLYDAEKQADAYYELTPASSRRMGALTGDDDMENGRMLPG